MIYKVSYTFLVLCSLLVISCKKKPEELIKFDDSQPLALAPYVEWAVVIDPYAAYRSEANWDSAVFGHCRKGDILQVQGKSIDENKDTWYMFESGWLPSNCLSIYSNRLKAQSESEKLTGSEK